MTYVVERYFPKNGKRYGPYRYLYRTERIEGVHKTFYVGYLGKGEKPAKVLEEDVKAQVQSGEGDLADAVRIIRGGEEFVAFDMETTGFSPQQSGVIQVCGLRCRAKAGRLEVIEKYEEFSNPGHRIPPQIFRLTGISNAMVRHARKEEDVLDDFRRWIGRRPVVGHNVGFDMRFLDKRIAEAKVVDTMKLSRELYGNGAGAGGKRLRHRLPDVAKREGVVYKSEDLHRADEDVRITALCFVSMAHKIKNVKSAS